jgi:RNA polymerase sigma factor (sigma-70 family)
VVGESDDQLIERARAGDGQAFAELYRRHRPAAESTARWLLRSRAEVDDVVSDAFAGVLSALRAGNGPRDNFRSYLLAAVRNGCRSQWRRIDDPDARDGSTADDTPTLEDPERYVEADTVARAFATLSPRWQHTLWMTEVEQRSTQEVAARLRLAPNATAALTHRAREAFATAYLAEHVDAAPDASCERYAPRLAAYVRNQLTDLQCAEVERHLVDCEYCQQAVDDLRDINSSLRTLVPASTSALAPLTIGTSVSTMPGLFSSGLFSSGLFVKTMTALLIATPLLFDISGGLAGRPTEEDAVRTVVDVRTLDDAERDPISVSDHLPSSTVPTARASAGLAAPASPTVSTVASEQPAPPSRSRPAVGAADPIEDGGAAPVVDDPVDPVVDDQIAPVVDGVVAPVVDRGVDPVVDAVAPVVDGVVAPVVDDVVAPAVDAVAPAVDAVAPIVGDPGGLPPVPVPTLALPPVTVPMLPVPPVSVPEVSAPSVSVPAVSVPTMVLPPLATVTVPATSLPPLTVPSVPEVSLSPRPVTAPEASVPLVSVPEVSVPEVTLPSVTVPATSLPPDTVPSVLLPLPTLL